MTWRVIDTGCEGCRYNLRGRKVRMEGGTFVHSSVKKVLPSALREEALRTVADSITRYCQRMESRRLIVLIYIHL